MSKCTRMEFQGVGPGSPPSCTNTDTVSHTSTVHSTTGGHLKHTEPGGLTSTGVDWSAAMGRERGRGERGVKTLI